MSESAKRIDAILKEELSPLLKRSGFRKVARNYYREHVDHVDVVNVQASQWNDGSDARFTVNVGVHFPAISAILEAPPFSGMPKEYNCIARARIGSLREDRIDLWWKVDSSVNDQSVAKDLVREVEECCLPWLEKMSNPAAVKRFLMKNKQSFFAAGVALVLGDRENAQELFDRALLERPQGRVKLFNWAEKQGLNVGNLSNR